MNGRVYKSKKKDSESRILGKYLGDNNMYNEPIFIIINHESRNDEVNGEISAPPVKVNNLYAL